MAKYIDADKLKNNLLQSGAICDFGLFLIEKQPAVDVQKVKHGKWVKPTKKFPYWDWKCNVCGCEEYRQQDSHGKYCQMNFCPHCGAKMDGKDGEQNDA